MDILQGNFSNFILYCLKYPCLFDNFIVVKLIYGGFYHIFDYEEEDYIFFILIGIYSSQRRMNIFNLK